MSGGGGEVSVEDLGASRVSVCEGGGTRDS